jgi:DNA transformation protein and related proteins
MAVSKAFLELVADLLVPLGPITSRRMFGGASIYAGGVLFALIDDDVLYLKADPSTKARFEAEGLGPFTYDGKTGPVAMSYWRAPERLYDEPDDMLEWAREAIGVARHSKLATSTKKSGAEPVAPRVKSKSRKA